MGADGLADAQRQPLAELKDLAPVYIHGLTFLYLPWAFQGFPVNGLDFLHHPAPGETGGARQAGCTHAREFPGASEQVDYTRGEGGGIPGADQPGRLPGHRAVALDVRATTGAPEPMASARMMPKLSCPREGAAITQARR